MNGNTQYHQSSCFNRLPHGLSAVHIFNQAGTAVNMGSRDPGRTKYAAMNPAHSNYQQGTGFGAIQDLDARNWDYGGDDGGEKKGN